MIGAHKRIFVNCWNQPPYFYLQLSLWAVLQQEDLRLYLADLYAAQGVALGLGGPPLILM